MELQNIADGGSQHVPQIAVQQIVYLDFDGETTSYNGEILALENVEVENPSLTEERIANIVAALNEKYASQGVRFVTERPESAEYSTIFIGKTAAFDSYGTFAGLAETIDTDNQNKSDNAFVTLDTTATDSQIIATISHEADHLLGTLNHGGKGLHAYAADIIIGDGVTSTELNISDGSVVVVSSGGVANNAVINSGGRINIYSDGTANSTTVNAGGNMDILSGGTANSTTVNSGGLYIYNGVANSTTVNAGGNMEIRSGGTATHIVAASGARVGITVASNTYIQGTYAGSAFEMKDAQITGYTVNSSFMDVSSGAAANNTTLNAGGLYIYDGVANSTTVNAGGDIYIFAGGVTNNTAINSGGRTDIHSGGTANSTTVNAGGNMDISSGGAANSTTLNAGGLYIYSAGTANDTTANSSGRMYIFSGGTANSTTVNSGGWMDILSGGTANSTTINYGGYMDFSGGVANSTAINSMGRMVVYDGAANSTTVNAGGTMYIAFDGTANSTTVNNGGAIYIYVGGTATHIVASAGARLGITVASDTCIQGTYADSAFEMKDAQIDGYTVHSGWMNISSGGTANSTTVNSGGHMYISSGGTANSTTVNSGGWMYISSDGTANSTTLNAGGLYIYQRGTANSTTLNAEGYMNIFSGGTANNTTVNSYGYLYVYGTVNSTTVSGSYARLYVNSGGTANSTTVNNLGSLTVSSGCTANSTTVNSYGYMYIYSGGTANSTTVNNGGAIYIYDGGTATHIVALSGARLGITVASNTYIQGTYAGSAFEMKDAQIDGYTVHAGWMNIYSGGTANSTTVNSDGYMYIGGTANSTTVNSGGYLFVYERSTANYTTVNYGGNLYINSGGTANSTTVNSYGYMYINSGGTANSTTVNNGGAIYIYAGGTAPHIVASSGARLGITVASNTYIQGTYAGSAFEMKNAYISGYTINSSSWICVSSGGSATETTVNSYGSIYLSSGGTATETTVNSYGAMIIYNGGSATETTVNSYGSIYLSSGGTATETTVNSYGEIYVFSGGIANNTTVNYGGYVSVYLGGTVNSTTVNSGGYVYISNSALAVDNDLNGYMYVYSGGVISNTYISSGGSLYIYSGGYANNVYVYDSGCVIINSGGTANHIQISSGGLVSAGENVNIDSITIASGGSYCFFVDNDSEFIYTYDGEKVILSNCVSGTVEEYQGYYIGSGASAVDIILKSGGLIGVSSGGIASNITQENGGRLSLSVYGNDTQTKITGSNKNGQFYLSNGVASGVILDGGSMRLYSGGSSYNTEVSSEAYLLVSTGAYAEGTVLSSGGNMRLYTGANLSNTVIEGIAHLYNDGFYSSESFSTIKNMDVQKNGRFSISHYNLRSSVDTYTFEDICIADNAWLLISLSLSSDSDQAEKKYIFRDLDILDSGRLSLSYYSGNNSNLNITFTGDLTIGGYIQNISVLPIETDNLCLTFDFTQRGDNVSFFIYDFTPFETSKELRISVSDTMAEGKYFIAMRNSGNILNEFTLLVNNELITKSLGVNNFIINNYVRYDLIATGQVLSFSVKEEYDLQLSDFESSVSDGTIHLSWNVKNAARKDTAVVAENIYMVNADEPTQKILIKTLSSGEVLASGDVTSHSTEIKWNNTMGFSRNLFLVELVSEKEESEYYQHDNTIISSEPVDLQLDITLSGLSERVSESSGRCRMVLKRNGFALSPLTVSITLQGNADLVTIADEVTFAAGESEQIIYLTPVNNAEYQGNTDMKLLFTADGYESWEQEFTLLDDEKPALSLELLKTEVTEGEEWSAFGKIKLDHALNEDLIVCITRDKQQLENVPDYVTIKAGETEAYFDLKVTDDKTAEIDKEIKITASADGVYSATETLKILDNDIPAIAFTINKYTVAENAGPYALIGTITRTDDSSNYVKVKFSEEAGSNLILPSTVTLGTDAQSVNFYIGIKDNNLVDGDRTAVVNASIYIDSCGCTIIPVSGETQVSFTIMNDDGEALGLSFNKSNVPENTTGAAKLTITRNTVNGEALTVNLNVTGTNLLDLPETVMFAAGENSVTIEVNTLSDSSNTGNQMAVITAKADGYAGAVEYLNISDIDLPDLTVSKVELDSPQVYAGKSTLVNLTLTNTGLLSCSEDVYVKLSLSDGSSLGTYKVSGPFDSGESKVVGFYVDMPNVTGSKSIICEIDPDNKISELDDNNNIESSSAFDVKLDYIVYAETSTPVLYGDRIITVSGKTEGLDGESIGNLPVEVLLKGTYGQKLLQTVSDEDGFYSVEIDTTDLYAGSYSVFAGNYGYYGTDSENIEIAGIKIDQSKAFTWDIEDQTSVNGVFKISNLSKAALSGVKIRVLNAPENFIFSTDAPATLDAEGNLTVNYTVTANGITEGNGYTLTRGWQKIDFIVESDEGVSTQFAGYFYSNPKSGILTLSEKTVEKTLFSGSEYFYEYTITNTGHGDTGKITVKLPDNDLMTLISNPVIENLAHGESATVTVKVDPTALGEDLALNTAYKSGIGISAENAQATSIDFNYTFVTNDKGNISITLTDEWTLYSAEKPMLTGAKVGVYNAYTGKLITTAYSDQNGVVNFNDLPEGKYLLKYSADKHNNAQEVVTVRGGETLQINTMLQVSTVNYTWNVRKVDLTDTYEIVLSTEFETNVPAPVVTIDGPTELPELAWGESTLLNFTVTNHGLISAQDFVLELPELQMGYEWKVLNDQPITIAPNSSQNFSVYLSRGEQQESKAPFIGEEQDIIVDGVYQGYTQQVGSWVYKVDTINDTLSATKDGYELNYFNDGRMQVTEVSSGNSVTYNADCIVIEETKDGITTKYNENHTVREMIDSEGNIVEFIYEDESNQKLIGVVENGVYYTMHYDSDGFIRGWSIQNSVSSSPWEDGSGLDPDDYEHVNPEEIKFHVYKNGTWSYIDHEMLSKTATYVISHGLNNSYDDSRITSIAEGILHHDPDAQILTLNWDKYSGAGDDAWYKKAWHMVAGAAGYVYDTARVAKEKLQGVNVVGSIGHSYGGHIVGLMNLGYTIVLDPAADYNFGDDDLFNDWQADENYKSSTTLGGDKAYGAKNYLLANPDTFSLTIPPLISKSPKEAITKYIEAILDGLDWIIDGSYVNWSGDHGLAFAWAGQMIYKHGFGNWYPSRGTWSGIINAATNDFECLSVNGVLKPQWQHNYSGSGSTWDQSVIRSARHSDYSIENVKMYQEEGSKNVTAYIHFENLANNVSIEFAPLEFFNCYHVYLSTDDTYSDDDILLDKDSLYLKPLESMVADCSFTLSNNTEEAYLLIYTGVNVNRENLRYELDNDNNFKAVLIKPEKVKCWDKLAGWYVTVCDGIVVDRAEHWIKTGKCPQIPNVEKTEYQAPSFIYTEPSRVNISGGGGGGYFISPGITTENTVCHTYFVPATSSETPDGGLMTFAAVMNDSAGETENICAHVKMEFSQTAITSREGFEGTLTLSNQAVTTLSNISFRATVLNSNDEDVSHLFEIVDNGADGFNITLDGSEKFFGLDSNSAGTFTVLYVPGRNTAVNGAEDYQFTGTISYTDSLLGDISIDLTPITLTVNPSPSLNLHYFVEQDVYSDDPDTPEIESAIPAEISVLVINSGGGDARNFSLSGFTPSIVENTKGLLLNYTMTDAALNGVKNNNGIADVKFGTISAGTSAVAQWWYTANVQGHYSDYSVDFTQMDYSYTDLYGNIRYVAASNRSDVSLIEEAEVHELIRSVHCGDDTLPDFLVNDLEDSGNTPDTLYLSSGKVEDVNAVFPAAFTGTFGSPDVTVTLTAELAEGWNYLQILDPGNGDYILVDVIRNGESINIRNYWQTDRYFEDELGVTHENRLHLLDNTERAGSSSYTLVYTAKDKNPLSVSEISGPAAVVKSAVESVTVTFNKAVNAETFTWEDIDLFHQGNLENNLISSNITITQSGENSFVIGNLGAVTALDGYYQLIVRTADISDTVGNKGSDGKALSWTSAAQIPAIEKISGIDSVMNSKTDEIELQFAISIDAKTLNSGFFKINGSSIDGLNFVQTDESSKTFTVSGLSGALIEGRNTLTIDLTRINGTNGNTGSGNYELSWMIDLTAPELKQTEQSMGSLKNAPEKIVFEVSENITLNTDAFTLKKDGVIVASDSLNVLVNGTEVTVTGIGSNSEGNYELLFDLSKVCDYAGNTCSGIAIKTWNIDRTSPGTIADFKLADHCDLGEYSNDNITSSRNLTLVGTLPEENLFIRIYQQIGNLRILLREIQSVGTALETDVNVQTGHSVIIAELTDASGNTSQTSLPIFVDELAFSADFTEKFEEPLSESPDKITITFSEEIEGLSVDDFIMKRGNATVDISSCKFTQVDSRTWELSGIAGAENGNYTLSLNLAGVSKKSSGLEGSGTADLNWTVKKAVPPTIVSCSLKSNQIIDTLSTFSITFSDIMNLEDLIESGVISQAVKLISVDEKGKENVILLNKDDFQYILTTNTLVWSKTGDLSVTGSCKLVIDHTLIRNAEGTPLANGEETESAMIVYEGSSKLSITADSYAVPTWYDYNEDGKLDLIVSEKTDETLGKIRIYLNTGTETSPEFVDYTYLQTADGDWSIAAANCLGTSVRFADVNGDQQADLIYGTSDGMINVSMRNGNICNTGTALLSNGSALDAGNRAVFDLYDWNKDGVLDIVSGAMDGKIYLYTNNGDWTFSSANALNIQLAEGWSAVTIADLNNDGAADIVSGDSKGNLYAFLNNGNDSFAQMLLAAGAVNRSRPFAADINNDGIADITVGYADGTIKVFTGEQGTGSELNFRVNTAPVFTAVPEVSIDNYNVTISWDAASDDAGIVLYKVKIGNTVYTTVEEEFTLISADPGTYTYHVAACDEYGMETWSNEFRFTVADITAPVFDGTPEFDLRKNVIEVSWNSAKDNVGIAGYKIELNGIIIADIRDLSYTISGLEFGDYEFRIAAYDAAGLETWSEKQTFKVSAAADDKDHTLEYIMPTANYGYGCGATCVGMLLGYYDLYGYCGYDVSELIPGEISVDSRGDENALLNTFIASEEYAERFVGSTVSEELEYTFISGTNDLNTAVWNSLADWLGTGQYWRGCNDYATTYYFGTLDQVESSEETYTVSGEVLPAKYADFKYGLNAYLQSVDYALDGTLTRTEKADTLAGGSFSFNDLMNEIDAGRGVLLSLTSADSLGHMVLVYGYNEASQEIIFDDTSAANRRMAWNETYSYAGYQYTVQSATTIVFDTENLSLLDVEAPVITLTADLSTPAQSVSIMAEVNETCTIYFSVDNEIWQEYISPINISQNGTYYFQATDQNGNKGVAQIIIVNIDKVAPTKPVATSNNTNPTNSDVTVEVAFSHDSIVKQYRIGNGEWQNYIAAFTVSENGTIYFRAEDTAGNESTNELVISNIDKATPEIPVGFNENISGYNATLDWSEASDIGVSGVKGYYVRYGTSELLTGEGKFITASEFDLTDLAVGTYYYQVKTLDNANNISEWSEIQSFEVKTTQVQNLRGDSSGLSWDAIPGAEGYIVEYSTDNFASVMFFENTGNKVDSIALPFGTYQWRVKAINGENFSTGENIISQHIVAEPQEFVSNADGNTDVFFANANGNWAAGYAAQHAGILNGWNGTNEQVTLYGKNKLADIFEGSSDANILVMTDDTNGDALFVDDIYTALPGTIDEQQARIAQIDEIRAGLGDDIVDMTSQRFTYIGDGVKIYGGLGNDTIWANNGNNALFGDAGNDCLVGGANNDVVVGGIGNDRMHGGGGDDIFTFGNNWGNDTIEQLDGGEITLWFESGEMRNWNADTLTYSDGTNSVKVSGVSNDNITLIFGDDGSLRYDELATVGCFDAAASEKIFEDKNKGMLA